MCLIPLILTVNPKGIFPQHIQSVKEGSYNRDKYLFIVYLGVFHQEYLSKIRVPAPQKFENLQFS